VDGFKDSDAPTMHRWTAKRKVVGACVMDFYIRSVRSIGLQLLIWMLNKVRRCRRNAGDELLRRRNGAMDFRGSIFDAVVQRSSEVNAIENFRPVVAKRETKFPSYKGRAEMPGPYQTSSRR